MTCTGLLSVLIVLATESISARRGNETVAVCPLGREDQNEDSARKNLVHPRSSPGKKMLRDRVRLAEWPKNFNNCTGVDDVVV